jgi:hypothetical protein
LAEELNSTLTLPKAFLKIDCVFSRYSYRLHSTLVSINLKPTACTPLQLLAVLIRYLCSPNDRIPLISPQIGGRLIFHLSEWGCSQISRVHRYMYIKHGLLGIFLYTLFLLMASVVILIPPPCFPMSACLNILQINQHRLHLGRDRWFPIHAVMETHQYM